MKIAYNSNNRKKEVSLVHSYLRAVGFSKVEKKKKLNNILQNIIMNYTNKRVVEKKEDSIFAEVSKEYMKGIGIAIRGEYDNNNEISMEYYYPYFQGNGITTKEYVAVEKHAEKESYAGICDDIKVGVSLIFYLQNVAEYMKWKKAGNRPKQKVSISLSALSIDGKIILPIRKNETQIKNNKEASTNRNHLIAAARKGDEDAIENLTLEDIDMYTMISKRIIHEDVFSLVDSYFMPYGIECDQYSILGEILYITLKTNRLTKEKIFILTVNVNDMIFDLCINKEDLVGEPMVGRRFKGVIWMQGTIHFSKNN